jgi:hypothetical protein
LAVPKSIAISFVKNEKRPMMKMMFYKFFINV